MSRVGLAPVTIPEGVTVSLTPEMCTVKGKLGELVLNLTSHVKVAEQDNDGTKVLLVNPANEKNPRDRIMWGTTRANINNMVVGVTDGFKKELTMAGVGYRANMQGNSIVLALGKSHEDKMDIPEGLKCEVDKQNNITVSGADKQAVGAFAAKIRELRGPEPYKGKGIRYAGEFVESKEGKKK